MPEQRINFDSPQQIYVATLADAPGVAGAPNTFLSVFNPLGSGRVLGFLSVLVQPYSVGANSVAESFKLFRITAATGGTLITPIRFNEVGAPSVAETRINNPTITISGREVGSTPPAVSAGLGGVSPTTVSTPGIPFLCPPGTGLAFRTADGDTDQRWSTSIFWTDI